MSSSRFQILKGVAALLGGLVWSTAATAAIADPFPVYLPTRIDWVSDFPFVPSTVSGISTFSTDARPYQFLPTDFNNEDPTAGPTDVPYPPDGSYMIFSGETILWSLGGSLSFDGFSFPICAYGDFTMPAEPCNPDSPPLIPIANLASTGFGPFLVSGRCSPSATA